MPEPSPNATPRRRLAAILYMDAVGYSRQMEADEAATLTALAVCRALVGEEAVRHGGRLVSSGGDSFLLQFDSAVEAIEAARRLQARFAQRNREAAAAGRLVFRMGVNVGDVVEQDGDLYGDGVNIAARLQSLAEPGGILTSANVIEQVADKLDIDVDDIGEVTVKNLTRPVRAYRVNADGGNRRWGGQRRRPPWRPPAASGPDRPKRWVALVLCLILGILGLHRYYLGRPGSGLLMTCTIGGLGLWWIADIVMLIAGDLRDGSGRVPDWT
ncbi:MAG: NINE protein [Azospirillaceae bacterium]